MDADGDALPFPDTQILDPDAHELAPAPGAAEESWADQLAALRDRVDVVHGRLAAGDQRMGRIEAELRANTEVTTQVRDFLTSVTGGLRVLGWLGVRSEEHTSELQSH